VEVQDSSSKYTKGMPTKKLDNGQEYYTDCKKTVTGWYHNEDLSVWGCYKGLKLDDSQLHRELPKESDQEEAAPPDAQMKKVLYGYGKEHRFRQKNKRSNDLDNELE